ncbi:MULTISPECIES: response regulator [unclassified Spirosoma]|uniref:response regulator n=1 Tax=unclassified Spirosoma TaxID=2621999 RepID=UPI00095942A9|nr:MULTISPECIES: response regulator [unclassified Spirosoma]MBN8826795.1 response regulator [Spirosoma sp.]OJW73632.1 MAG: hypothetical protein BGO59_19795 [Spirosoma sp. 48-14]
MTTQNQPFDVLVVDDDPSIYDLLHMVGQREFSEATFRSAATPQDVINTTDEQLPHLVLLDIDFHQEKDGIDWLPMLQARFQKKVPVVIFSQSDSQQHIQQAYQAGAVAYTQKPDELRGWKDYVVAMKKFWYETATIPQ